MKSFSQNIVEKINSRLNIVPSSSLYKEEVDIVESYANDKNNKGYEFAFKGAMEAWKRTRRNVFFASVFAFCAGYIICLLVS